jgi:hypothetical protein
VRTTWTWDACAQAMIERRTDITRLLTFATPATPPPQNGWGTRTPLLHPRWLEREHPRRRWRPTEAEQRRRSEGSNPSRSPRSRASPLTRAASPVSTVWSTRHASHAPPLAVRHHVVAPSQEALPNTDLTTPISDRDNGILDPARSGTLSKYSVLSRRRPGKMPSRHCRDHFDLGTDSQPQRHRELILICP